ncbi:universal stress protein [Sphingomonas oligophenolica]|uniref:Universal stress protein n=1 Tax=Sphingomonas oligophenolica TaxID=301154 RepID=A0ABU9Y8E1_9SPHN
MKNILVLVHDDPGQEARIQAALDITRALDGHLTCLDIAVMSVFAGDVIGAAAILAADERRAEVSNRARLEPRIQAEDVPFDWIEQCGYLEQTVLDAAGLADVIVLNRDLDDTSSPDMYGLVGEVLIRAGRPIVAVPRDTRGFDVYGHALIAWDGSPQVDAALRAATPLLRLAATVTLLEIDDGSLRLPATEAATYLSRHGIHAAVRQERATFDLPSTIILDTIDEKKPAYLVMGGFGHSRFAEAALGGVTKRMLHECTIPIFLAH